MRHVSVWLLLLTVFIIPVRFALGSDYDTLLVASGQGNDGMGVSVCSLGDFNGDGYDDFGIAAHRNDGAGVDAGMVWVYYGGPTWDGTPDLRLYGEKAGDRFGWPIAGPGDVNGDGYSDLVVGAWAAGSSLQGRAYVFFGGPLPDSLADLTISGEEGGDQLGSDVGGGGDFNCDGYVDFVVGAPGNDCGGSNSGRVYVFYGGPLLDDLPDFVIDGEYAGQVLGEHATATADINGDGRDDLLIGAYADAGGTLPGKVLVFYGDTAPDSVADLVLVGESGGDFFGISVGGVGDINGDGFTDLGVGARGNDDVGSEAGKAYVFYGGPQLDDVADVIYLAESSGDHFGRAVAPAGDMNRDGYADLLIGASHAGSLQEGRAYLFFGGNPPVVVPDHVWLGEGTNSQFSGALSSAGDFDDDGLLDVVIGAPGYGDDAGRVYLFGILPRVVHVPADFATIGDAVNTIGSGSTVLVAAGVYYEHDLVVGNGVSLVAESGPDMTIIDALQLGRILHCANVDSTTEIRGFALRNGLAPQGGGILCESSSPLIEDCIFADNTASVTGGGGFAGIRSGASLSNCTFVDNVAISGANIHLADSSSVILTNTIVSFGQIGQGIACTGGSEADLSCSDVFGNQGGDWAGCIASQQGVGGNLWTDPLFCSREYHMYELDPASPCAKENNPGCGLIGALPAGCDFTGVVDAAPQTPDFLLEPNTPNPFNPSTTIRFQLADLGDVDLAVFSPSGRRVASVATGSCEAGLHVATWNGRDDDGRDLPSGVYFIRLQAGSRVETRKTVLLR